MRRWFRRRRRKSCTRISRRWPWNCPAGARPMRTVSPWLDPPPAAPLAQARELLQQLEAIDAAARVTAHGRSWRKLGMHPRLAHMLRQSARARRERLACDLAAILSERDILRASAGARDADLRLRVAVLRGDERDLPPGIAVDARAKAQARAQLRAMAASACARTTPRGLGRSAPSDAASSWLGPIRIASRRARGDGGRYLLANGRGARFAEAQALAKSEFIVAAELDGAEREARIFLAAPIASRRPRCSIFGALMRESAEIRWDERAGSASAPDASAASAPCCWHRPRCAIPIRRRCSGRCSSGSSSSGSRALPWTQGVASVARAGHADAAISGADVLRPGRI